MKSQKILSYSLIAVYIFLITFFIFEHWINNQPKSTRFYSYYDEDECTWSSPCVNLCQNEKNLSSEEMQKAIKHFVHVEDYYEYYIDKDFSKVNFTINWKTPECHFFETKDTLNDNETVHLVLGELLELDDNSYSPKQYCINLEKDDDDETNFFIHLCKANLLVLKTLDGIFSMIACTLLIIPVVIYSMTPELRGNIHGKACIILLSLHVVLIAMICIFDVFDYKLGNSHWIIIFSLTIITFGYSVNFCMALMCYDIYMTFKNFSTPGFTRCGYWKFFIKLILLIFVAFFAFEAVEHGLYYRADRFLTVFLHSIETTCLSLLFILIVLDLYFLVSTFLTMKKHSNSSETSENTRFYAERDRFLLYSKLYAVLCIMWMVEYFSIIKFSYETQIIGDLIKIISTAIIAKLFLLKEETKSLWIDKYLRFNSYNNELSP